MSIIEDNIQLKWKGLSSGEFLLLKSFTNLSFAKLSLEKKDTRGEDNRPLNSYLLLLDEVDLGLHPEWQRKWASVALPIIEQIFEGKHLQIIMTTHSPIMLSDFFKENIIFLEKNGVKADGRQIKQTFGQNIYTLFKNSFFLDSLMGEHARQTIEDTIAFLTDKIDKNPVETFSKTFFGLSDTEQKKRARKVIDSIGEPIIVNQLEELYTRAFPDDKEAEIARLEKEIEERSERLIQLKGGKEDGGIK